MNKALLAQYQARCSRLLAQARGHWNGLALRERRLLGAPPWACWGCCCGCC